MNDCNIDNLVLARFDADAEYLEDEFDFTFEGFEMPEAFADIPGMQ